MEEVFFRVDMNSKIATGHMMRCLSIADSVARNGLRPVFVLSDSQAKLFVEAKGYETVVLNTCWSNMESELTALDDLITSRGIKVIIIDSYKVTEKYLTELSKRTRTVYIDDIYSFDYPVDVIICYAPYWKKFDYNSARKLVLGCEYVPLRPEFSNMGEKTIAPDIKNILLLSGGSDPYHAICYMLKNLQIDQYESIEVICGFYNTDYQKLYQTYKPFTHIKIYKTVENIIENYRKADIAISAGGTSLYELCACGVPTISYAFADNQLDNVIEFDKEGIIEYIGDIRNKDVSASLNRAISNYSSGAIRRKKSELMQQLIDGNGADRIAKKIIESLEN